MAIPNVSLSYLRGLFRSFRGSESISDTRAPLANPQNDSKIKALTAIIIIGHDSEGEPAINGSSGSKVLKGAGFIETKVKLAHTYEIGQIFVVFAAFLLVLNLFWKLYTMGQHLL